MNEREALAVLLASFRKINKFSDPVLFAESARYLVGRYGTPEAVAKKLGKGKETVRALAKVAEMPKKIKRLISSRELQLTIAFELLPFSKTQQVTLARVVTGLPYRDARAIIRYASSNPHIPIIRAKEAALKTLERQEFNLAVVRVPRRIRDKMTKKRPEATIAMLADRWFADGTPNLSIPKKEENELPLVIRIPRKTYGQLRTKSSNIANLIEKLVYHYMSQQRKHRGHD